MYFKQTLLLFFAVLSLVSCKRNIIGNTINNSSDSFTIDKQIEIGDQISTAILNNPTAFPILDKTVYNGAYDYLQNNILEVIVNSPALTKSEDFNWNANIIELPGELHAFFLPNGEFFIHVDLLKRLRNDAELLGLVAHELAYVENELVMENLKSEFGATLLNEIAEKKSNDRLDEIAIHFNTIEYSSQEVLYADSFAVAAICPFSYEVEALVTILTYFDDLTKISPDLSIDWVNRKRAEFEDRRNKMNDFLAENPACSENSNVIREDEYKAFKASLQ